MKTERDAGYEYHECLPGAIDRVTLLHVAYKGDAPAIIGILAGETSFVVTPPTTVLPHVKSGKLKALAVTGAARWAGLPDVPTAAEQGFAGFDVRSWLGLAARAGTARPVVERLRAELLRTIEVPEVRAKLESFGGEVQGSTPEEMRNRVASEIRQWTKVMREAGIESQ